MCELPLPTGGHWQFTKAAGTVIRFRPATLDLGVGAPATKAWTVMYHSRTAQNQADAVTGTVITPTAAEVAGKRFVSDCLP